MNPTTDEASIESTTEPIHPFRTYGQYTGDPTAEQLRTYFTLEPRDLEIIATRRRDDTRLGMALQLCTLRFLGTFLDDPTAVPEAVLSSLNQQLQLRDVNLERYRDSDDARLDHRRLLTQHLEYRAFEGAPFLRVGRMLLQTLRVSSESTPVLIDAITRDLERHRVVLPGIKRIIALIGHARRRASAALHRDIDARLTHTSSPLGSRASNPTSAISSWSAYAASPGSFRSCKRTWPAPANCSRNCADAALPSALRHRSQRQTPVVRVRRQRHF